MKRTLKKSLPAIALLLSMVSCQDAWLDHYSNEPTGKIDQTLTEYIESQSNLTTFARLLRETGYDTILSKPQSYTVWAFQDSPADSSIYWGDSAYLVKLLTNHIASFQRPVSTVSNTPVTVLNKKIQFFDNGAGGATFGAKKVLQSDISLNNGLLHIIEEPVTFRLSLWEYLDKASDITLFRNYINSMWYEVLDHDKSFDDNGVLIDSVMTLQNLAKLYWGNLDVEDSTYTMLIPTDAAWMEAYNRVLPYYRARPIDGDTTTQKWNALQAITNDLVFSGRREVPTGFPYLVSTGNSIFLNPDSLFLGWIPEELSNGLAYKITSFPKQLAETWCPPIRVEAEQNLEQLKLNAKFLDLSSFSSLGTGFTASRNNYLYAVTTSTSPLSTPSVKFEIPNTLAATYKISVVFLPTTIADSTDKRPCKVRFSITYINSKNSAIVDSVLTIPNNTFSPATIGLTNPATITKMTVMERFTFPYSNLRYPSGLMIGTEDDITTVKLKVESVAKNTEKATYCRDLRIDCILLEPVQ